MSEHIQRLTKFKAYAAGLLVMVLCGAASAASVTFAAVEVDTSGATPVGKFVDVGVGKCASKAQGEYGCMRMVTGDSGPLNFFIQGSPGWMFEWIEIREPFADWGDPVPTSILDEFTEMGGGGGNFFNANGRHEFMLMPPVRFFNFHDANTLGNPFEVQYRVSVTNGTDHVIIHPIIENKG